ncbi:hypothetical protein ZWY2020_045400 [Hordeum vulgare]|nr:hypothetical protein ZWY2020_045400 [Hordeum vulgare]
MAALSEHCAVVIVFGAVRHWRSDGAASADPLAAPSTGALAPPRTNLPRECMGFLDFPFLPVPGDPRRFPGHREVLRYLEDFTHRFDLLRWSGSKVVGVRRRGASSWTVSYRSRKLAGAGCDQLEEEEVFDAVVVCNGHFTEPRLADVPSIDGWPGKQMHNHSYRVPDPFLGQVVVIIGYNPSGMDISRDIAGVAKEVHVAIRATPAEIPSSTTTRANLWLHPMIVRAEKDGSLVFEDGSRVKADAIVHCRDNCICHLGSWRRGPMQLSLHCTGYKYSFPFLEEEEEGGGGAGVVVSVEDNSVGSLYKHVFPPRLAPHISFVGLPFKAMLFPVFQLQSSWVAGALSGRIELPSPEEMMMDVAAFYSDMEAHGRPKRFTHDLGLAERCGRDGIEEWRKAIHVKAKARVWHRPESYRDEHWDDDDDLLDQAHRDLAKYL